MGKGVWLRWFKLDSDFLNDTKVVECLNELGSDGLVVWLAILSTISEQWHGDPNEDFQIYPKNLAKKCSFSVKKLEKFCQKLPEIFEFSCQKVGKNFQFRYPKFLKKQASYFRGATTKNKISRQGIRCIETEVEVEVEIDKNIHNTSKSKKTPIKSKSVTKHKTEGTEVWLAYADAFASKYNNKPIRNAKTNSICKRLVSLVGKEKAIEVVEHYLSINDAWYLKSYHKLDFCLNDYQKILTSLESGINISGLRAQQIEKTQTTNDAIDRGFELYNKIKEKNDAECN